MALHQRNNSYPTYSLFPQPSLYPQHRAKKPKPLLSISIETERGCEPRADGSRHRSSHSFPNHGWHSVTPQYTSPACGFIPSLQKSGADIGTSQQNETIQNSQSAYPLRTEGQSGDCILLLAREPHSSYHNQQVRATGFRKRGASLDCSHHHPKKAMDGTYTGVSQDLNHEFTPAPTPAQQARLRQRPSPGSKVIPPKRRSSLPGRKNCPTPKRQGRRLSSIAEVSMSHQPIPRKPLPIPKDSFSPQIFQPERPKDSMLYPSSHTPQNDPLQQEMMDQEGWLEPKSSWDSDTDSACSSSSNLEHGEDERLNRVSSALGSEAISGIKKSFFSGISRAFSSNSALVRAGIQDCAKRRKDKGARDELLNWSKQSASQYHACEWNQEAPRKRRYSPNKDDDLTAKPSSRQWRTRLMCGHCGDIDNEI